MALLQKINVKKFLAFMRKIGESIDSRYSIVDAQIIIALCEKTTLSHHDLLEELDLKKSSVDRPIARLLKSGLIEREIFENAATKKGESRSNYKLSKKGLKELENCY